MNYLTRWQRPQLTNWSPFGRLASLKDEIDRLFDAPLAGLARSTQSLSGWSPALDVYEQKDHFTVKTELPGLKREDIEVSMEDGVLSISGERKSEEKSDTAEVRRTERFFGRFQRTVSLPTPVNVAKIEAQYKDGILTVTLPKTEEAKPKRIAVNVN